MKRIITLLLILLTVLSLLTACSGSKDNDNSKDDASAADTADDNTETIEEATEAPVATYDVKTDYATLKYPEEFKDQVDIKIDKDDVYTAKFTCGDVPLFDLTFGGKKGVFLGTIIGDDGKKTEVRVISYDIDKKADNYNDLLAMSGSLNVIIDNLSNDYNFAAAQDVVNVDRDDVYEIKTSVVSLYYPTAWKDEVTVKEKDKVVSFSCGDVKLFAVLFGSDKGDSVGSYKDTNVSIISYDIEKGKLSDTELTKLRAMQDDLNVVIDNLKKEKDFKA